MRKRNHVIPVRLNAKELRFLEEQVEKSGLSREEYIRSIVMGGEVRARPCEHHTELLRKISGLCNNAIHRSDKLLQLTLAQNAEKVAEMLQKVHCDNCSVIQYNDENSLACVLSLAYYSAQDSYAVYRELQGGEGFADLVFVPRTGNHNPAMIVELKWNQTTGIALEQIKDRNYIRCLKDYHGKVLFVGVNYDKKSKKHACQFEMVEI